MEILKVSAKSNPNSVAGALAGFTVLGTCYTLIYLLLNA